MTRGGTIWLKEKTVEKKRREKDVKIRLTVVRLIKGNTSVGALN